MSPTWIVRLLGLKVRPGLTSTKCSSAATGVNDNAARATAKRLDMGEDRAQQLVEHFPEGTGLARDQPAGVDRDDCLVHSLAGIVSAIGDVDPMPARTFGQVHGSIGCLQKGVGDLAVVWEAGDPDRDRDAEVQVAGLQLLESARRVKARRDVNLIDALWQARDVEGAIGVRQSR